MLCLLALGGELEIFAGIAEGEGIARLQIDIFYRLSAVLRQKLPEFLRMDLFILRRLLKQAGKGLLPFSACLLRVEGIAASGLRFARKTARKVLHGL